MGEARKFNLVSSCFILSVTQVIAGWDYTFVPHDKRTWKDAEAHCRFIGGHLVSISSLAEERAVTSKVKDAETFWIGIHDQNREGRFLWSDGTSKRYTNWIPGEPNNFGGLEHCGVWSSDWKKWKDDSCQNAHEFVCKTQKKKTVVDVCLFATHRCNRYAHCYSNHRAYNCKCKRNYYGNGFWCKACREEIEHYTYSVELPGTKMSVQRLTQPFYPKVTPMDVQVETLSVPCTEKVKIYDGISLAAELGCQHNLAIPQIRSLKKNIITLHYEASGIPRGLVRLKFASGWKYWGCKCFKATDFVPCFMEDKEYKFPCGPDYKTQQSCIPENVSSICVKARFMKVTINMMDYFTDKTTSSLSSYVVDMTNNIKFFWRYFHPVFAEIGCGNDRSYGEITRFLSQIMTVNIDSNPRLINYDSPNYWIQILHPNNARRLYAEAKVHCSQKSLLKACQVVAFGNIMKMIKKLRENRQKITRKKFEILSDALRMRTLLIFPKKSTFSYSGRDYVYHGVQDRRYQALFLRNVEYLSYLTKTKDANLFKEYLQYVPNYKELRKTGICQDGVKGRRCQMKRLLELIHTYFSDMENRQKSTSSHSHVIYTKVNYRNLMMASQTDEILRILHDQTSTLRRIASDLKFGFKKALSQNFHGLKTYFLKIESFNNQKATADIAFIRGQLSRFQTESSELSKKAGNEVGSLLKNAVAIAGADVAESALKLAFAIAEACNPFKYIFAGGSATGLMDATAQLAQATAQLSKAITLKNAVTTLTNKATNIARGFYKNRMFQLNVYKIVKKVQEGTTNSAEFDALKADFLEQYDSYSPRVSKAELTEMPSYWEEVVSEACNVIESGSGTVAGGIKAYVFSKGYCWKTKITVKKLIELYLQIYDFQFDLMTSLAACMRALTAIDASKEIAVDYDHYMSTSVNLNRQSVLNEFKIMSEYSYVMYHVQQWHNMAEFCDILEYQNGQVRPSVCNGIKTELSVLLAYKPSKCRPVTSGYVDLPTQPRFKNDKAYLNLTDLFSDNPVMFQAPDKQWLIDNNIIRAVDRNAAIYVRSFNLHLPILSNTMKNVVVRIESVGPSHLTNKQRKYLLVPAEVLVSEYQEGGYVPCFNEKLENPYNLCPRQKLPGICYQSKKTDVSRGISPSILSLWRIKIHGYKSSDMIKPATELYLKARLELCKLEAKDRKKRSTVVQHRGKRSSNTAKCCLKDQYWSKKAVMCQPCPVGSKAVLNGYYCAKTKS